MPGTNLPGASALLFPPLYFRNRDKNFPIERFLSDAAAGALPSYSLVEPEYTTQSEENPQNIASGEAFAASVVNRGDNRSRVGAHAADLNVR